MKAKKLVSVLKGLSIVKDKYPKVNCGGCGAVALYISQELNKREIKHDIVWIGNSYTNKKQIKDIFTNNSNPSLSEFSENGIFLSHVMIKVKKYFIDGSGVFKGYDNTEWTHRSVVTKLKIEQLNALVSSPDGWNDRFDRSDMPKIKKLVNKVFGELGE